MKTKEELKALKEEVETLNKKLAELSEEELEQVSGGVPRGKIRLFAEKCKLTFSFDDNMTKVVEEIDN